MHEKMFSITKWSGCVFNWFSYSFISIFFCRQYFDASKLLINYKTLVFFFPYFSLWIGNWQQPNSSNNKNLNDKIKTEWINKNSIINKRPATPTDSVVCRQCVESSDISTICDGAAIEATTILLLLWVLLFVCFHAIWCRFIDDLPRSAHTCKQKQRSTSNRNKIRWIVDAI